MMEILQNPIYIYMYYTIIMPTVLVYKVMQVFYHQRVYPHFGLYAYAPKGFMEPLLMVVKGGVHGGRGSGLIYGLLVS